MVGRIGICAAAGVGLLMIGGAARAGAPASQNEVQRQLDAMTQHDLCARDDAGLKRLHRRLSKVSAESAGRKR